MEHCRCAPSAHFTHQPTAWARYSLFGLPHFPPFCPQPTPTPAKPPASHTPVAPTAKPDPFGPPATAPSQPAPKPTAGLSTHPAAVAPVRLRATSRETNWIRNQAQNETHFFSQERFHSHLPLIFWYFFWYMWYTARVGHKMVLIRPHRIRRSYNLFMSLLSS